MIRLDAADAEQIGERGQRERERERHAERRGDEEAGHEHDERRGAGERAARAPTPARGRRRRATSASDARSRHTCAAVAAKLLHEHGRHQHSATGSTAEIAAPDRPLAGSRSPRACDRQPPGRHDEAAERSASSTRRSPRSTACRCGVGQQPKSAVTRGCWPSRSAAMPPTHISHTSSSRAISSVHGNRLRAARAGRRPAGRRRPPARRRGRRSTSSSARSASEAPARQGCRDARHARIASQPRRRRRARAPRSPTAAPPAAGTRAPSMSRIVMPRAASSAVAAAIFRRAPSRAVSAAASMRGPLERARGRRRGSRASPLRRREEPEHAGDVARARHVARDLEEALLQRRAGVVLVAVDDAGLQRGVDLAERHRRRARAHQLDRLDVDRRLDRPDLEAGELARLGDVARARDHLAEAERVAPGQRPDAHRRLEIVGRLTADRPVDDPVHVSPVAPEEREVEHLQLRRDAAPDRRARDHEVDEPLLQLLHDLAFLAERAARKEPDGRRHRRSPPPRAPGTSSPNTWSAVGPARHRVRQPQDDRPRADP